MRGQTAVAPSDYEHNLPAFLDAFRQVEVASVSDAMEQILHEERSMVASETSRRLKRLGFPVYATGVVPSTCVGHYRFGAASTPVRCDGVPVQPGDIISADQDGVVVIPRVHPGEVLARAQKLDDTDMPCIPSLRSSSRSWRRSSSSAAFEQPSLVS